jgi:hypothetical protein
MPTQIGGIPMKSEVKEIKDTKKRVGKWAFLGGFLLAFALGLITAIMQVSMGAMAVVFGILAVLGLVVGWINITKDEAIDFIIVAIGLGIGSAALGELGNLVAGMPALAVLGRFVEFGFKNFNIFVAGAVLVPAFKAAWRLSHD